MRDELQKWLGLPLICHEARNSMHYKNSLDPRICEATVVGIPLVPKPYVVRIYLTMKCFNNFQTSVKTTLELADLFANGRRIALIVNQIHLFRTDSNVGISKGTPVYLGNYMFMMDTLTSPFFTAIECDMI